MKHSAIPALCAALAALPLSACASAPAQTPSQTSHEQIEVVSRDSNKPTETHDITEPVNTEEGLSRFTTQLFKKCFKGDENTLLSPFSVYAALSMTANGAKGQTLDEMLSTLGAPSTDALNSFIAEKMSSAEQTGVLDIANSMFIIDRPDITMNETTVGRIEDIYKAEIFHEASAPSTENKINAWANEKTHEMIPVVLTPGTLNDSTVSVILNAIAFENKWLDQFDPEYDIVKYDFHNFDGTVSNIYFLTGTVSGYMKNDRAQAFLKYYEPAKNGKQYAFVAILPNEDISIDEYVNTMSDSEIPDLLDGKTHDKVVIKLPKFSYDTEYKMKTTLAEMGMPTAFDGSAADFTDLATSDIGNNISIGEVIHKAHIELDENGTKAAAVTAVIMTDNAVAYDPEPPKEITLDRPFVYAICDMDENMPIFIGSVAAPDNK